MVPVISYTQALHQKGISYQMWLFMLFYFFPYPFILPVFFLPLPLGLAEIVANTIFMLVSFLLTLALSHSLFLTERERGGGVMFPPFINVKECK